MTRGTWGTACEVVTETLWETVAPGVCEVTAEAAPRRRTSLNEREPSSESLEEGEASSHRWALERPVGVGFPDAKGEGEARLRITEAVRVAALPGVGCGRRLVVGWEALGRWRGSGRGTILAFVEFVYYKLHKN